MVGQTEGNHSGTGTQARSAPKGPRIGGRASLKKPITGDITSSPCGGGGH